ncbi:polysaccharide deacetylase family protein [Terrimonas sp. NA20]|uniref:Polysaccharide deacetylase family protein n=1 Tax=Terrimonas ginsenosidimutans TaxID=2908004 RepID=A0ABS9KVC8_9BACT|nr:polysaccharide deacetylase family protein [Terrimonas ginsenosidimutans]MCG2616278.1 polysaccharide deacetylase family protein [Terrimonas ginsenosidimutans]
MRSPHCIYILMLLLILLTTSHPSSYAQPNNKPDTTNGLTIYLTFDDGPMDGSRFIDSLVKNDSIPLEVLVTGFRIRDNVKMTAQLNSYRDEPLIEIANHSFSHANGHFRMYYSAPAEVVNDILRNENSLQLLSRIVRLPGRNTWRIGGRKRTDLPDANAAADSLASIGYFIFGWDLEWRYDTCENRYYSAKQMLTLVKRYRQSKKLFTPGHLVILCHDWMLPDVYFREQLSLFVKAVKSTNTDRFAHLSAYPCLPWNSVTTPEHLE